MHRLRFVLLFMFGGLLMVSCKKSSDHPTTYFDSLVLAQVKYLSAANPTITKTARMDGKEDRTAFVPDSTIWKNELDVFLQLTLFERPAYHDAYQMTDGLHDEKSNLLIRRYATDRDIPITELKFYYYKEAKNLKKIEAIYRQANALYSTTRQMVLEFEEISGKPVLNAYAIDGSQKMILSDSMRFSVQAKITYPF